MTDNNDWKKQCEWSFVRTGSPLERYQTKPMPPEAGEAAWCRGVNEDVDLSVSYGLTEIKKGEMDETLSRAAWGSHFNANIRPAGLQIAAGKPIHEGVSLLIKIAYSGQSLHIKRRCPSLEEAVKTAEKRLAIWITDTLKGSPLGAQEF